MSAPVTNKERDRMRALRHQGMSVEAIGAELGRSGRCVWTHVADIAVRCTPGRPGMGREAHARMLAARAAGATNEEIASRFGIAPKSVGPLLSYIRKVQARASA